MLTVKSIRSHIGIQIGAQVLTTLDAEKHNFEMQMNQAGVFVYCRKTKTQHFVPHTTISACHINRAEFLEAFKETPTQTQTEPKRGRPKKTEVA